MAAGEYNPPPPPLWETIACIIFWCVVIFITFKIVTTTLHG